LVLGGIGVRDASEDARHGWVEVERLDAVVHETSFGE
jgi:hypothetical protein